jgi:hypothetical protein
MASLVNDETSDLPALIREERGSFGTVLRSSTVARFRHFATAFGLMPDSRLSRVSEACDRCIAALTANVVVALPRRTCPMLLPSIP